MNKKSVRVFVIGIAVGIIILQMIYLIQIKKVESYDVLLEVKVTTPYINVRSQPTSSANKIHEVVFGEKYDVIEYFDEDPVYTWYKISYQGRRVGWIASDNKKPWVMEIK